MTSSGPRDPFDGEAEPVRHPTVRSGPFDPPPELRQIRERSPLCRLRYPDGHVGWLVTGYAIARAVLADPRFSARAELKRGPVVRPGADPFIGQPALPGWFVDMDAPEHTRYRRLLAGHFAVRKMNELRPRIEQIIRERLDAMERLGPPVDLVREFTLPVPSLVICELLGVPYDDRDEFQRNSAILFELDASAEDGAEAMRALTEYLLELIGRKRLAPTDDLLSGLVANRELTDIEIAGAGVLLLTAGHETVASMLGLGAFVLLCDAPRLAALRARPSTIDTAVEELLRYLTIFQFGVPRTPLEDVELDGQVIKAGESVTISLPAANRDPARFEQPDALDLTRTPKGHLAFGYGVHQCIGQHLARVQLRLGYLALFDRFPTLRLAAAPAEIPLGSDMAFYCVHKLPVAW